MNLNISREWLLAMAEEEGNGIISVGGLVTRIRQAEAEERAGKGEDAMNWMERCLAGTSRPDDIDDFIGRWHDGEGQGMRLHEYLGLTWDEYARWVELRATALDLVRGRAAAGG